METSENIICLGLANYAFAFPHLAEALTALNFLKALLRKIKLGIYYIYYLLGRAMYLCGFICGLSNFIGPYSVPRPTAKYQGC